MKTQTMKIKQPEIVPMFRTSAGAAVETLEQWKEAELSTLLATAFSGDGAAAATENTARFLLSNAETVVAILGVVERKGRPVGAKDKKPRKRAANRSAEGESV